MTATTMERSWLVQRLETPHGGVLGMADNPFSFGGGKVNGGLSKEAMGLLRGIFSFDYMGAAEFEYGAVPEALNRIANSGDLAAWTFPIPFADVPPNWRDREAPTPAGNAVIYALAPKDWQDEVEDRVRQWAIRADGARLKEQTRLNDVLRPPRDDPYPYRVCGWLELDNGWFFFTDRTMWEATCHLFGVEVPA